MIIEFQIIRSRLEQLLHERIIAARPCILQPFEMLNELYYVVGVDVGLTKLAIADEEDSLPLNVDFGSGNVGVPIFGSISVTLKRLQLEQKVDVLISSQTMLRNANPQPPVVLHVMTTIVFDLAVTVNEDGRPRLCADVADVRDLDLPDPAMEEQILATIQKNFRNCANFGLGALAQMAGGTAPIVINAGIAATPNLGRIAIRFDTANNAATAAPGWTSFFAGNFPSLLGNSCHLYTTPSPRDCS
jgi:hypothetical protein